MQGVGVTGMVDENLLVERSGFAQPPGAMVREGLLKGMIRSGVRAFRHSDPIISIPRTSYKMGEMVNEPNRLSSVGRVGIHVQDVGVDCLFSMQPVLFVEQSFLRQRCHLSTRHRFSTAPPPNPRAVRCR
jgi:hypothetical protein